MSRRLSPHDRATAALSLLPLVAIVVVVARWELARPLVGGNSLDGAVVFVLGLPALALAAALHAALGTALARALVHRARTRATRWLDRMAWMAILGAGALTAIAGLRPRPPTFEQYLAALPVAGRLPVLVERVPPGGKADVPPQELVAGALHVRRALENHQCAIAVTSGEPAPKPFPVYDEYGFGGTPFEPCGSLTFLADQPRGLWIAVADDGARRAYRMDRPTLIADLTSDMITAGKRPPPGYLLLGLVGLAATLLRSRPAFPLHDRARCREGRLEADGAIHFLDGDSAPARPPVGAALAPGPAVVEIAADRGPFRGTPALLRAAAGTIEEMRIGASLASAALGLAIACLGGAPLAAALW